MNDKKSILGTLLSQIDEKEYEKVNSRMGLAAKISDALAKKGMKQREFAEKLGKKPSEISKWLSGTHNFTHDTLVDIQSILGIELLNLKVDKIVTSSYAPTHLEIYLNSSPSFFNGQGFCQKYNISDYNISDIKGCSSVSKNQLH